MFLISFMQIQQCTKWGQCFTVVWCTTVKGGWVKTVWSCSYEWTRPMPLCLQAGTTGSTSTSRCAATSSSSCCRRTSLPRSWSCCHGCRSGSTAELCRPEFPSVRTTGVECILKRPCVPKEGWWKLSDVLHTTHKPSTRHHFDVSFNYFLHWGCCRSSLDPFTAQPIALFLLLGCSH